MTVHKQDRPQVVTGTCSSPSQQVATCSSFRTAHLGILHLVPFLGHRLAQQVFERDTSAVLTHKLCLPQPLSSCHMQTMEQRPLQMLLTAGGAIVLLCAVAICFIHSSMCSR